MSVVDSLSVGTEKLNLKKTKSTYSIGNKCATVDKTIQLVGIVLLDLVGLSGSEYILGKKRA